MIDDKVIDISRLSGRTHRTFHGVRYLIESEIEWEAQTSHRITATAKLFFTNNEGDTEPTQTGTVIVDYVVIKNDHQEKLVVIQNIKKVLYAERPQYAWVDAPETIDLVRQLGVLQQVSPPEEMQQAYKDLSSAVELLGELDEATARIKAMFCRS